MLTLSKSTRNALSYLLPHSWDGFKWSNISHQILFIMCTYPDVLVVVVREEHMNKKQLLAMWAQFVCRLLFMVAESLLLWATVLESVHRSHKHHSSLAGSCPTAKAGLFGGAAFMALDSTLFWLICLMLAINARADHFGYEEEEVKGNYEDITSADYGPALGAHSTPKV